MEEELERKFPEFLHGRILETVVPWFEQPTSMRLYVDQLCKATSPHHYHAHSSFLCDEEEYSWNYITRNQPRFLWDVLLLRALRHKGVFVF